ncbi:MAG: beta-phosphoglucomutase family hydrolase [Bacteroidales bacterium]|nr:beta-phosphoglucomutase family hydrolase [Bacteroidales bacterium]
MKQPTLSAVIFDLDGVITQTALVHSAAWKTMFDEFLQQWSAKTNTPFRSFDHEQDYLPFVDGKPRYKGVQSFLEHRGINIPYGTPADAPEMETVCGLGNRKNQVFNEVLARDGVEVYRTTVALIDELVQDGIKIGVASSSKNCKAVLEAAGLLDRFKTRVDGEVSVELGLHGKPEPDIFTVAADNLGVSYDEAVIVEDAVSGVQAGRKGNFGLVLGIAREGNHKELRQNGADIVVDDIGDIGYQGIKDWFAEGLEEDNWQLVYTDYDAERERSREALLAIGNGYFGTRGAPEETKAGKVNYPGTYIAGLYNRLTSKVAGRDIENEDFVNAPNWLPVTFKIDDGEWLDINNTEITDMYRRLDFRSGELSRVLTVRDDEGRETLIQSQRMASMANPHLAALQYSVSTINYSGTLTMRSLLDGDLINDGVARYRDLNQQHLQPGEAGAEGMLSWLLVSTTQSAIDIALAARLKASLDNNHFDPEMSNEILPSAVASSFSVKLEKFQVLKVEKNVAIYTSKPDDTDKPLHHAKVSVMLTDAYQELLVESRSAWEKIWDELDMQITGDRFSQKLLRLHLYHLMVSFSVHNKNLDAGITARGLHGEAYRGHIFWDEMFILPLYALHFKGAARAMLMYRYRRLDAARAYAAQHGRRGAMFPWQSGSDGREETQVIHLNPVSGEWGDDYSSLQRHVSLAIAYNVWQYMLITGDMGFVQEYGAEMFLEICRFWASMTYEDKNGGRLSIKNVMGPDEFHEAYPDATEGGLKDNAYTNLMVVWTLEHAHKLLEVLGEEAAKKVRSKIDLTAAEIEQWTQITHRLNLVIEDDIISQYDGYFDLDELDWDYYRKKYGNIHRLDRLLKAEGDSADHYKVAKQADTLMTFYALPAKEVDGVLEHLGYDLSEDYLNKNLHYYLKRTSHGSTLSRVVHAQLANMIGDKELSWELYSEALASDYTDIQGGTTGEGIHAGVMAGTVLIALQSYAGVDVRGEMPVINPHLPAHWRSVSFNIRWRNHRLWFEITPNRITIKKTGAGEKLHVKVVGKELELENEAVVTVDYGLTKSC